MNGVLNFYKDQGITSFKAVDTVKKLFNVSKCGHLGTLDPMAEGVLPICLGYATRFADYLSSVDKEYIAQFKLGITTDSFDTTGSIVSENNEIIPIIDDINLHLSRLEGVCSLTVPGFSAKKINGVRAYKLARNGAIEDAGVKEMEIYSCHLLSYEYPLGVIKVKCGKGTYIRSIINELGKQIGCGAAMSGLIRSANGSFYAKDSFRLSNLQSLKERDDLSSAIIPVTDLLPWGKAVVKNDVIKNISNGISPAKNSYLSLPIESDGSNFFITDTDGRLIAAAERQENSTVPLKIKMVFI
ncbi:MAG: tRNA pseudouridine(55) synthase TruB [Deferribacterales bacterium]|nr:tRNA pseudouridine(55) synthase TruB [Deferribacterales bacterium]